MPSGLRYRLLLTGEVFEFYQTLRLAERRTLKDAFRILTDHPFSKGDHQEQDQDGRLIEVLLKGRFTFTFWTDHSAKEVRILRVDRT